MAFFKSIFTLFFLVFLSISSQISESNEAEFLNPIFSGESADPSVVKLGDFYYLLLTSENTLTIFKSPILTDFRDAESSVIFRATDVSVSLRAGELHLVENELYAYFTVKRGSTDHMRVIKAADLNQPLGDWGPPTQLLQNFEGSAADGTVLKHGGKLFFVWSSENLGGLFIAEMTDATHVGDSALHLRQPLGTWECQSTCVDEAPHFFYANDVSYLVFSASASSSASQCLGLMSIANDKDPLVLSHWNFGDDNCVFERNDESRVFAPHATFVQSPDGAEIFMVYHASSSEQFTDRVARLEKITLGENGPIFPRAHGFSDPQAVPSGQRSFNNPIIDVESGDPQAVLIDGYYYLIFTHWGGFFRLAKSPTLTNFRNAEYKDVATLPEGQVEIWAPEILMIRGQLYIYYNSMPAGNPGARRNYVIKADDPTNPFGSWGAPIMLAPDFEYISIDGSVLQHGSKLYFAWATLVDTEWGRNPLQIYIAEMSDATTVVGEKKLLRKPTADWECQGGCTNEGPFFIYNRNVSYMLFSASSTWDPNYSLGLMSIPFDKDPMNLDNWDFGGDGPVFWSNADESVYTTGHAAFVSSKDGTETWMTYHQTLNPTGDVRIASIEKITWDEETGRPVFPRPHGRFHPLPLPSGDF